MRGDSVESNTSLTLGSLGPFGVAPLSTSGVAPLAPLPPAVPPSAPRLPAEACLLEEGVVVVVVVVSRGSCEDSLALVLDSEPRMESRDGTRLLAWDDSSASCRRLPLSCGAWAPGVPRMLPRQGTAGETVRVDSVRWEDTVPGVGEQWTPGRR
ncbi:hypothetical protein E2C01_045908 [Portunus trituberculatus]|uniref:Uncharacterized protein n=1 Tax=Portunus trituberculatus TaxID=210409 RepID=A0A5B7G387_PORTR|nr:hypothetical protein [Portunus trituberculatus]